LNDQRLDFNLKQQQQRSFGLLLEAMGVRNNRCQMRGIDWEKGATPGGRESCRL
jgi:hypothetical protein